MVSTFTINVCISTYRGDYGGINDPGLLSFGAFVSNPYTYAPAPPHTSVMLLLGNGRMLWRA